MTHRRTRGYAARSALILTTVVTAGLRAQAAPGAASHLTLSVEGAVARLNQIFHLSGGTAIDASSGTAFFASAGLRQGAMILPDLEVAVLAGGGPPYRAYTVGGVYVPGRDRGPLIRVGVGLVERPDEFASMEGGASFYETRQRLGFTVQLGYRFAVGRGWQVGPIARWISSGPEQLLSARFELLSLGLALRFR